MNNIISVFKLIFITIIIIINIYLLLFVYNLKYIYSATKKMKKKSITAKRNYRNE